MSHDLSNSWVLVHSPMCPAEENKGALKMREWKMQEWKIQE